jgi:hypothetical protein
VFKEDARNVHFALAADGVNRVVYASVRPSVSSVRHVRKGSCPSDKGQCLVDLGQGKSGLTLSTVAATSLPH